MALDHPSPPRARARPPVIALVAAVLVGLALGLPLAIPPESGAVAGRLALGRSSPPMGSTPVQVPLRRVNGALLVDARFGRDGPPIPMLLDTGSPTAIPLEMARRLGSATGIVTTASPDGATLDREVHVIPSLRVGAVDFREVGAVEASANELARINAVGGVLGANLMRNGVWQIDVAGGALTIAETVVGLPHVEEAVVLDFEPATPSSPSPLIHVAIAGVRARPVLLDTGYDGGFLIPVDARSASSMRDALVGSARPTRLATASGSVRGRLAVARSDVRIGDVCFPDQAIAISDALSGDIGIVGLDVLAEFIVTLDWPARRVYLDPVDADRRVSSTLDPPSTCPTAVPG